MTVPQIMMCRDIIRSSNSSCTYKNNKKQDPEQNTCALMLFIVLSTVTKRYKQIPMRLTKCSIYIQGNIFSFKNEWNCAHVSTWMSLEDIMLHKTSHSLKDNYHITLLLCSAIETESKIVVTWMWEWKKE